ncbi:MAG: aminotransferase class V-fold PLP-dependent enzyme, partial [Lentisphaeria bacterium]
MIYFDNAASTPVHSELLEKIPLWLSQFYPNPDATHEAGYQSLLAVQRSENQILALCNAEHKASIIWLGTATEALNLGIIGYSKSVGDGEVLTTAIEHKAVLEAARVCGGTLNYL